MQGMEAENWVTYKVIGISESCLKSLELDEVSVDLPFHPLLTVFELYISLSNCPSLY